jgi:hypothetical protein
LQASDTSLICDCCWCFEPIQHDRVLWSLRKAKYSVPIPPVKSHIRIEDFVPQSAVLAHKNVKVFLSHCGQNSFLESVWNEVPILALPFMGDQVLRLATCNHNDTMTDRQCNMPETQRTHIGQQRSRLDVVREHHINRDRIVVVTTGDRQVVQEQHEPVVEPVEDCRRQGAGSTLGVADGQPWLGDADATRVASQLVLVLRVGHLDVRSGRCWSAVDVGGVGVSTGAQVSGRRQQQQQQWPNTSSIVERPTKDRLNLTVCCAHCGGASNKKRPTPVDCFARSGIYLHQR